MFFLLLYPFPQQKTFFIRHQIEENVEPCTYTFHVPYFISRCESCNFRGGNGKNEKSKKSFCKHACRELFKDYEVLHVSVK